VGVAISRRAVLQLTMAPAMRAQLRATARDLDPTTSRVYPGPGGRLVYAPDEQGNVIHDASHAGYRGGGVALPTVPVREVVWPVNGDNRQHIQAAIDKVSSRVPDTAGFRGAVLLRAGYYRLASALTIRESGVVLRGEGMGDTGTILIGTGTGRAAAASGAGGPAGTPQSALIVVGTTSGVTAINEAPQAITADYVPVGSRTLTVTSAQAFRPGDSVIVRRIGNQAWIDAVGMSGTTPASRWRPFNVEWDRVVTDVQGGTITIDAPITCAIEQRWGGGEVIQSDDAGRTAEIGIENLRAVSEFDPTRRTTEYGNMDRPNYVAEEYYADEEHYRDFVVFTNAKNCWVRNATALHFVNSMVGTQRGTKWITVQDCESREPISRRMGARRFTFALRGQLALVQRCRSDKGRHSFMTGQPTGSSNVFLDCTATAPYSSSEPHEQWSTGSLYDNVRAPLTARFWKDINIGWAGANTVFWNCEGSFLVQKPPTAQNYSFGHLGLNAIVFNIPLQDPAKENGQLESLDRHVTPRSLYLTQLRDRLGDTAVRQIAVPDQLE
jgi:hypothetical protein